MPTTEEYLAAEAANVHKCLDINDVPREVGGRTLSLWGRVLALLSKPVPLNIEASGALANTYYHSGTRFVMYDGHSIEDDP